MGYLEILDLQVCLGKWEIRALPGQKEILDNQVRKDLQVNQVCRVSQGQMDNPDLQEPQVLPEIRVRRVHKGKLEQRAILANPVNLALKVLLELSAQLDQLGLLAIVVLKALRVSRVNRDLLDQKAKWDFRETLERQVHLEIKVRQDFLELRELPEHLE